VDWIYLLTAFDGRISRQPFWIAFAAVFAAEFVGHFLAEQIEGDRLSAIVDLAFSYPEFAILAKRAHDRDIPTWVPGAFFAGGVLLDFLMVIGMADTTDEPGALTVIGAVWMVFGLALLADLGIRRGTTGPNRYGPDPLV
jgi:uncharacterized membrane protein YhaH (DUF805 family)